MKIDYREPEATADISAGRGNSLQEFARLSALTVVFVTVAYFLIGITVDLTVRNIDFEQEMWLFSGFNLTDQLGASEEDSVPQSLSALFNRLIESDQVPPIDYSLLVIDDESPNAFAFPGGAIGVTSGLLDALDGDLERAFVLGHELGHFFNRDHLRGLGRAIGVSILYSLTFDSALEVNTASTLPLLVLNSSYSRQQETRADEFGLRLVMDVFGTTEGFEALFEQLEEMSSQPGWSEMFSTHPLPRNRISRLNELVLQLEG